MKLDAEIDLAILKVQARREAGDTRGERDAISRLTALRIRRMKRDKRRGLFSDASKLATLAATAWLVWLATPGDGEAAELTPWISHGAITPKTAMVAVLAIVCGLLIGVVLTAIRRAAGGYVAPHDRDAPIRAEDYTRRMQS